MKPNSTPLNTRSKSQDGWIAKEINRLSFRLKESRSLVERETIRLEREREMEADLATARDLVQKVSQQIQEQVHSRVAKLVTDCLRAVFGPEAYEFRVDFDRKRSKTEAQLVFVRDGETLDPLSACGGGVVDVTAFALRLACLLFSRPRKRKLLVLDESFKHVSSHYISNVAGLLEKLADEYGVQILLVTHRDELAVGTVVKLG